MVLDALVCSALILLVQNTHNDASNGDLKKRKNESPMLLFFKHNSKKCSIGSKMRTKNKIIRQII